MTVPLTSQVTMHKITDSSHVHSGRSRSIQLSQLAALWLIMGSPAQSANHYIKHADLLMSRLTASENLPNDIDRLGTSKGEANDLGSVLEPPKYSDASSVQETDFPPFILGIAVWAAFDSFFFQSLW